MISVSLFLVVVMSGMGALLNANRLHQKSQNMRSIMDSLSFVLEDMSRNLRNGYNYHCFVSGDTIPASPASSISIPKSCSSGWAIAYEAAEGDKRPLFYNDQGIYYVSNDGKIFKSTDGAQTFIQLTPNEVVINTLSGFSVLGAEAPSFPNTQQPIVLIKLIGTINAKGVITPFSLQTSVTQRVVDL